MGRVESVVLFALPALATLTIWCTDPLWNWASEAGMLLLASLVSVRAYVRKIRYNMLFPIGAIAAWGFLQLALGWTVYRYATLDAALRLAACASVAFSAAALLSVRQRREEWLRWFSWFAVVVGLVSVLAYHTSPGKILWIVPGIYPDNWGPFPSRNNFAQFLELSFPVAVYQFDLGWGRERRDEARCLAALAPALLFACGVASASRAGSAILTLEALWMTVLMWRRMRKALAGLVLATGALIFVMGAGTLVARLGEPDPLSVRREVFRSVWAMVQSRPWTGYGLGTFSDVYPGFAEFDPGTRVEHAHNDWLEWASEGGIPFAALWAFFAIFIVRRALRPIWGVGILAVLVHALVDYPFARLGITAWFFALAGALLSVEHGVGSDRGPEAAEKKWRWV
jgi:O-antigen ligase